MLFIIFLGLFALDVFTPEASTFEMIGGFLIHLVPSFLLTLLLLIAWRFERMGGILNYRSIIYP